MEKDAEMTRNSAEYAGILHILLTEREKTDKVWTEKEEKEEGKKEIMSLKFRMAERGDTQLVLSFIRGIADYEKLSGEVIATREVLERSLFDEHRAEVLFAMEDGTEVAFALFFHNFSTFVGRVGLYLEDLFVLPEYRGRGIGQALLKELAKIGTERNCGRMEWVCLDWNEPSIAFYKGLGARAMDDWTLYRLSGDALKRLGTED